MGGFLTLCRVVVGVFYSHSRLGNFDLVSLHIERRSSFMPNIFIHLINTHDLFHLISNDSVQHKKIIFVSAQLNFKTVLFQTIQFVCQKC